MGEPVEDRGGVAQALDAVRRAQPRVEGRNDKTGSHLSPPHTMEQSPKITLQPPVPDPRSPSYQAAHLPLGCRTRDGRQVGAGGDRQRKGSVDAGVDIDDAVTHELNLEHTLVLRQEMREAVLEVRVGLRRHRRRVDSAAALVAVASGVSGPTVVQRFLDDGLRAVAGVVHEGQLLALVHQRQ